MFERFGIYFEFRAVDRFFLLLEVPVRFGCWKSYILNVASLFLTMNEIV